MASRRILIVEDEAVLIRILGDALRGAGYEVYTAVNGAEGLAEFRRVKPDLVIADIMMPDMDGMTMVREIRREDRISEVLFLSARSGVEDVCEGFKCGGNDYLRKPFALNELLARVAALLARHPEEVEASGIVTIGEYRLDSTLWTLTRNGTTRRLTARESAVLTMLATNRGEVVGTEGLLKEIWGDDSYYNLRSLNVFISRLRGYLEEDKRVEIQSLRGVGYRLIVK
jgi:DNA-binding response OmpR family regulator